MKISFCYIVVLISLPGLAQQTYVGRVCDKDTKLPLKGVEIKVDSVAVSSNALGFFQVVADTTSLLFAKFEAYESASLKLPKEKKFIFYLKRKESENDKKLAASFYKFVGENLRFPSNARRAGIQGTTIIYFQTDTLGVVLNTSVVSKLDGGCSEEVIRVLQKAPTVWYAIKKCTRFELPVVFKISGSSQFKESVDSGSPVGVIRLEPIFVTAVGVARF